MSFPKYPAYKDSGKVLLGEVPAHWKVTQLKHCLISLDQGWSPQCENHPAEHHEWGVLKVGCVNGGVFDSQENKALPVDLEPVLEYVIRKGDVLVSRANTRELVGSAAVVPQDFPKLMLCDKLYRLKVDREASFPEFVTFFLSTPQARSQIELEATGASSSMQNIAQDTIRTLLLALPPLPEQRAIAAFLDAETTRIDALVAKQEALIATLQEKRRALISHAVTKSLDPAAPMKDSGVPWLGEVPAHWEVKRLKFIAEVRTGVAKGRDLTGRDVVELPYLRVANVQDGYLDLSDVATIALAEEEVDRYLLKPGDVLMNEGGDYDKLGRGYVWRGEIDDCVHQNHVFAVRLHDTNNAYWVNLVTQSHYAKQYFISRSKQSTNLASISSSNIYEWPVVLPPLQERVDILAFVKSEIGQIDILITKAEQFIALLREHRAALIAAAVTGQIDVRGYVAEDAPASV